MSGNMSIKESRRTNGIVHEHSDPDWKYLPYDLDKDFVSRPKDGDYGKGGVV